MQAGQGQRPPELFNRSSSSLFRHHHCRLLLGAWVSGAVTSSASAAAAPVDLVEEVTRLSSSVSVSKGPRLDVACYGLVESS